MSPLAEGSALGRYQIVRPLGAGAMGEVYLADDPQIGRQLAIKTVRLEEGKPAEIEERKRRLLREARAAGRLLHPNIVTLFDAGEDGGTLFLAFEYVEGTDLAERLGQLPRLTLGEVLRLVREAAEGLDFAHRQGIVHRDIKPSNLLLTADGRLKIADFGIAKLLDQTGDLTMTGSVVGSPHYLSPEQVRGDELDGRSDLFSLGVVLFEMLCQRRPFSGESLTTLVYQILHHEPPALAALGPDLSPRLELLTRRLLAKERDQRFATAREVGQEIARLERELPESLLAAPASAAAREQLQETSLLASPSQAGTAPRPMAPPAPPSGAALAAAAPPPRRPRWQVAAFAAVGALVLVLGGIVGWAWLAGPRGPVAGGATPMPTASTPVPTPRAVPIERPGVPPVPLATPAAAPTAAYPTVEPPRPTATREPRATPARPAPTPPPTPTAEPPAEPTPAPTPPPIAADRTIESGLALAFQVVPEDAIVKVGRTVIGQAGEWSAKKREGRAYTLPEPGDYLVRIMKEGLREAVILVRAREGGPSPTTISVNLLTRVAIGPGGGPGRRRLLVSEGVAFRGLPETADVEVDGARVGTVGDFRAGFGRKGLSLPPGPHKVRITAPGYLPLEVDVEVMPGAAERRGVFEGRLIRQ